MIYMPPVRRYLLLALAFLSLIILYRGLPASRTLPRLILHPAPVPPQGIRVPLDVNQKPMRLLNSSSNHMSPPSETLYSYNRSHTSNLDPLFQCSRSANPYTGHIRLPSIIQNISATSSNLSRPDQRAFWNPTLIALPYWSENQYLVVSRILTDGNHQENVLCEANICHVGPEKIRRSGEKPCTPDDLEHLGPAGGMRCASPPVTLSVPPTPADKCEGKFGTYVDIPGFHDPRIFWSGRGEPLMMVNTQSRYACFGLWMIDLRSLYPALQDLLGSSPYRLALGHLKSYPTLTELTRNPPSTRESIEKNWLLFFPSSGESYVQYDLQSHSIQAGHTKRRGRTFAKLLGNGLTTTNLTDPLEQPCLNNITNLDQSQTIERRVGTWHQATNSLRLVLCNRTDPDCYSTPERTVFFAIIHRKFPNELDLPLRYERFIIVWSATAPFNMLGISSHPILLFNETATGWTAEQNWADAEIVNTAVLDHEKPGNVANSTTAPAQKELWAYFTYTVSIAYAWGRQPKVSKEKRVSGDEAEDMHLGYLDDDVVLGIGVDDKGQVFSRVSARALVACMKACPGTPSQKASKAFM